MKFLFAVSTLAAVLFCVVFQPDEDAADFKIRLQNDYEKRFEKPKFQEYRIWNSKVGHFKTNAKFVKLDGTDVVIEKAPKRIIVPVESLSTVDHDFINEFRTASMVSKFTEDEKLFLFATTWHPSQRLTWENPDNKLEARMKTKRFFDSRKSGKYSGGAYLMFTENGFEYHKGDKKRLDPVPYDDTEWYQRVKILSPGHIAVLNEESIWIVYRSLQLVD